MHYHGSCHCGQIAFDVEGDAITQAMACNCSMCRRKGSLLWFVPRERLALATPEEQMGTYTFHKHVIRHRFCPTCGIHLYGEAPSPQGVPMAAINVRCVEDIDLAAIPVRHFDGRAV